MPYRIGLDIGGAEPIISSNACISVVPPTMNGVRWWMLWGRMSRTGPRPSLAWPPAWVAMNAIGLASYSSRSLPCGKSVVGG